MMQVHGAPSADCASANYGSMRDIHSAPRIEEGNRAIFLTFDDGPNPYWTPQVLAEHRVGATFCVIGVYAAQHPELIQRIVAEGHDVVNYTMTHPDLSRCTPDEVRREISEASHIIDTICPQVSLNYLRAPYGIWASEVRAAAALFGLDVAGQNLAPLLLALTVLTGFAQIAVTATVPWWSILVITALTRSMPSDSHQRRSFDMRGDIP